MLNSKSNRRYQLTINIIMILVTITMILPLILLFMSSITSEACLYKNGYSFFPQEFSNAAYSYILKNWVTIFRAYAATIGVTAVGTFINLLLSSMMAYALSDKNLPFRNVISFYVFFTMLFNGGLVPQYIMWTTTFDIKNTYLAYLLPNLLMNAMNVLLLRTYFTSSIPDALYEAAQIDGAGRFKVFRQIVLPLSKPILVSTGLFSMLAYWNDWTNGLYYISKPEFYTVQVLLNKMLQDLQALQAYASASTATADVPQVSVRMAIAFVALLPVLIVFPFLQKYFEKGIAIGAVKG